MKTKTVNMYDFEELSEKAQEAALQEIANFNSNYDWWESVYENAEMAGLKITSFDLDRNRHAEGDFVHSAEDCANYIIDNHGEQSETYITAESYLNDKAQTLNDAELDANGEFANEYSLDCTLDDLDADFLRSILECYAMILEKEWEYINSKEVILESINANGYMFTIDGELTS
jgi:hypothetical protein